MFVFFDSSDGSLRSNILQDTNPLSDIPRGIPLIEGFNEDFPIAKYWQPKQYLLTDNLTAAFCKQTYIQLIFVRHVLNERKLPQTALFQPSLSTSCGLTRTRADERQAVFESP